jgi:hypothetical protein
MFFMFTHLAVASIFIICVSFQSVRASPPRRCPGPSVDQVVRAARARLVRHGAALRSARLRLGWSSLLPRISGRVARSSGSAAYMDIYPTARLDQNQHLATRWEVKASWDLTRLVFDDRELRISSQAVKLARWRRSEAERVVQLYFERCRLLVMTRGGGSGGVALAGGTDGRLQAQMKLMRVTALLNVMTGGLLSRRVKGPTKP